MISPRPLLVAPFALLTLVACPGPTRSPDPQRQAQPKAAKAVTASPSGKPAEVLGKHGQPPAPPAGPLAAVLTGKSRSPADRADAKKKPLTIEALYRLKSLGDPRWSPDGKRILFSVTSHDLAAGKSNPEIYLVDVDDGRVRRMTRDPGSDHHPRWAPDGRSFLFISGRKDGAQIWRMPVDGGEPEQLTKKLATGASAATWSPDGKKIAFASSVYPEHGADQKKNRALIEDRKKSPIKAHLADELLFRHWTSYKDGRRRHILLLDVDSGKLTDLTPGDHDSPAFSARGGDLTISPDSKELCFVSNREPNKSARAWTTNKDLWVVPLTGGKAVNLTASNRAYDGRPSYSPDGRYISFVRQVVPGYEADRYRLALYDRKSGAVKLLTESFDSWTLSYRWAADSRSIVFQAPVKGRFPLFRVAIDTGAITRLALPSARAFDLAGEGGVALTFDSIGQPTELYLADLKQGQARRLTSLNQDVARAHDIRPAEELWLPGAGGKKVHTFIVKPHGFSPAKRYPLIINVHGGPQYQWSDHFRGDWQVYPAAGYVLAFFNPHGSIGYGQAYTAAISKDWGGKAYRDVMRVTDALERLPYVDAKRVGAMGWSYGGYMMAWLLGHTDRFKAVASMMGLFDLESFYGATEELWFPEWDLGGTPWSAPERYAKWSPSRLAHRFKTPTLVIGGEKDYRVPYTQSLQLFTALRRRGVPARLVIFPNDGHWPSWVKSMPLYYAAHLDWFHRYLGGDPSPYDLETMVRGRAFKGAKKQD